jgi:hypothetical protein
MRRGWADYERKNILGSSCEWGPCFTPGGGNFEKNFNTLKWLFIEYPHPLDKDQNNNKN